MKKTCNRCAAKESVSPYGHICELGYKTSEQADQKMEYLADMIPLEACPKPLTIKRLVSIKIEESRCNNLTEV